MKVIKCKGNHLTPTFNDDFPYKLFIKEGIWERKRGKRFTDSFSVVENHFP